MKKTYNSPKIDICELNTYSLLSSSTEHLRGGQAGTGDSSNPVNFGRGNDGDDW